MIIWMFKKVNKTEQDLELLKSTLEDLNFFKEVK